jgi:HEAT repeat protein
LFLLLVAGCHKSQSTELMAHGKPLSFWLEELKSSPDVKTRKHAARVLGNIGEVDASVTPALTEALNDKTADVRQEAKAALEKIKK